jgi:hypothetical protein
VTGDLKDRAGINPGAPIGHENNRVGGVCIYPKITKNLLPPLTLERDKNNGIVG